MLTDAAGANRAQERICDGVRQNVGIGMSFQSEEVRNFDAAQNQFPILAKTMNVVTDSAARGAHNFKSITPLEATMLYFSFISLRGRKSTRPPAVSTRIHPAAMSHKLIPRSM